MGSRVDEIPTGRPLRAVREDREVLEDTLAELAPRVKAWLVRDLGPSVDVDDALQDSLTAIARALPKFRGGSSVSTYAYRITMRIALRYHRARRSQQRLELVPPPVSRIDPESRAMSRQALRRIYRALDKLPVKRRRAFVLCCIEGLAPQDAAAREGIRPDAMRSRLRHARAEVARLLRHDPYLQELLQRAKP